MEPYIIPGAFIIGAVVWVLFAILAYQNAPRFGRRALTWGILGLVLGPLALFALYVLPRGHVEAKGSSKKQDPQAALYEVPKKKR